MEGANNNPKDLSRNNSLQELVVRKGLQVKKGADKTDEPKRQMGKKVHYKFVSLRNEVIYAYIKQQKDGNSYRAHQVYPTIMRSS